MSVKWDAVVSELGLDQQQAVIARYLIDRGKDRCLELWEAEAEGPAPGPLDYIVSMKSGDDDSGDDGARIIEYLSTKKKLGAGVTFLQLQYERERVLRDELRKVVASDPGGVLVQLGVDSVIFDIDTGYSPAEARITRLLSERAGLSLGADDAGDEPGPLQPSEVHPRIEGLTASRGVPLSDVQAALSIDETQWTLVRYVLDELHHQCAELWSTMAFDFGLSPLEFLVDVRLRDADAGPDAVEPPLTAYLRETRCADGEETFLARQAKLEGAVYHGLARVLGGDQARRLREVSRGSLLNVVTGQAPIVTRFAALYEENRLKHGIDLFCQMPFEYAHVEDTGDVLPCCPSKFRLSIGNLKQHTLHEVWHSRAARAVRDSINDKTFRFCKYHACEYLKNGRTTHGAD